MWPHAPAHHLSDSGAYIVTAATYHHIPLFRGRERIVHDALLALALQLGWRLEAWAVFDNHYHFVAQSPDDPRNLKILIRRLHAGTATAINRQDGVPSRRVWANYWDTLITSRRSFFARLAYVHSNAVKHGIVSVPATYPWCSAGWFEAWADRALVTTVYSFKTDRQSVMDVECGG